MSIIYGFYHADKGEMFIDGNPFKPHGSQDAIAAGIGMVHQHFMLVNNFTVLENVILGAENGWHLGKSLAAAEKLLGELARDYGLEVPLHEKVEDLPVGLQQRVEILKALYRGARILILDEPTGVLTPQEADHLFEVLKKLRDQGTTVILITHKLREILAITDQVSIMRRGEMVAHVATKDTDKEQLAELMVGRKVRLKVDKGRPAGRRQAQGRWPQLWTTPGWSGSNPSASRCGPVKWSASPASPATASPSCSACSAASSSRARAASPSPVAAGPRGEREPPGRSGAVRNFGLGHVPEDRHKMGLINRFEAKEAFILGYHRRPSTTRAGCRTRRRSAGLPGQDGEVGRAPAHPEHKTANFSGGNQQKLVIAREVEQDPDVLLVGQPTRGVDIGAIEYIHQQIIAMRDKGKAVLLVSVELDEIMSLSDRIWSSPTAASSASWMPPRRMNAPSV
jgi:simple sugar transport system ATP-binding protein